MYCIALLSRSLPSPDPARLRTVFFDAMRATGVATREREYYVHGDDTSFHFAIWGDDAIDCHAYVRFRFSLHAPEGGEGGAGGADADTALVELLRSEYAVIIVEPSPIDCTENPATTRRVALAVADLVNRDTIALLALPENRIITSITPETISRLRSPTPADAFAHGVTLVEDD